MKFPSKEIVEQVRKSTLPARGWSFGKWTTARPLRLVRKGP